MACPEVRRLQGDPVAKPRALRRLGNLQPAAMTELNRTDVRLEIGAARGVDDTGRPLPQNDTLNETVNVASDEKLQRLQEGWSRQFQKPCGLNRWLDFLKLVTHHPDIPPMRPETWNTFNQAPHRWASSRHGRIHPQDRFLFFLQPLLE